MQSQDYAGAKWALGQRTRGLTDADIDRLFDGGQILRTHVMRPTWHFVTPRDAAWLLRLTAPRVKAILAPYDRRLEIDGALLRQSHRVLERSLRDRTYLTRPEIASRLRTARIEASGQRLGHLVMHAELDGVIISGPRRDKQFTYGLMAERAPHSRNLQPDEALAELALRFFTGHGPAQLIDFAWWSGLTMGDGRKGVAAAGSKLTSEVIGAKTYWSAPGAKAPRIRSPLIHLLPNYDELLIAYRDREGMVDESVQMAAASIINHVVVVNGRVFGGWKRTPARNGIVLELGPLGALDDRATAALQDAAAGLARFLEVDVEVSGLGSNARVRAGRLWG